MSTEIPDVWPPEEDPRPGMVVPLFPLRGVFLLPRQILPLHVFEERYRQMIDDVLDGQGRGTAFAQGVNGRVPVYMGTLGKALGTAGAFVAGSNELIETLIQFARTYVYTTAMPAAVAAATLVSLDKARREPQRRAHLNALIQRFRRGAAELGYTLSLIHI